MKQPLLAAAALLLGSTALAQPTLTAVSQMPTPGLTYTLYTNTTFNPGPAGAAQSWDFSTQPFSNPNNADYVACGAPNTSCATFPGSNLVQQDASSGAAIYFKTSASALSMNGVASNSASGNIVYSDPEDMLRFPFSYNSSYVDPFAATIVNGGLTFYRKGVDSVTADAWGSLKTPAGTFPNTLRTKQVSNYRDSTNFGGTVLVINYRAVIYSWRDAAHKDILYSTSTLTYTSQAGTNTNNYSGYTANMPTSVAEAAAAQGFSIFPNPARGSISWKLRLDQPGSLSATLTDLSGRVVKTFPSRQLGAGEQQLQFPAAELGSGAYLLSISANGSSAVHRVLLNN